MAQNIYDDAAFFEGYGKLPRSRDGLAMAGEWPSLQALLPELKGLRVLDLGCGLGYHCRWAAEQGAASVTGLDISERMLSSAREICAGLPVEFRRADLETADFGANTYDLVLSSLAVHYIEDFDSLCARVRRALKHGGRFVFSMEHPVFAARATPDFMTDAEGRMVGAVYQYLNEGKRLTNWIADGVVKFHRLISTTVNALQRAGLRLDTMDEWAATDADIAAHPEWAKERYEPMFLLFATTAGEAH
ncbi:MAG TPA: class I SAM-dependent methyltransferase [Devosia sp.]